MCVNFFETVWCLYCTVQFFMHKEGTLQDCNNLFWAMLIIAFFSVLSMCILGCLCCTGCVFLCVLIGVVAGSSSSEQEMT